MMEGHDIVTIGEITQAMNQVVMPLRAALDKIDEKVNRLYEERFTRSDAEKLRQELMTQIDTTNTRYMPRELSEQRHAELLREVAGLTARVQNMEQTHDTDLRNQEKVSRELSFSIVGWCLVILGLVIPTIIQLLRH